METTILPPDLYITCNDNNIKMPPQSTQAPPLSSSSSSTTATTSVAVPFVYHTCPMFHQDDLDRERAELSDAERAEFDHDVAGTTALPWEPTSFVEGCLQEFHDALVRIPSEEKQSYAAAVERTSIAFVLGESPPLAFLRAERFDAGAAARRFVDYWSFRHKIFGDDRAFRRMIVTKATFSDEHKDAEASADRVSDEDDDGDGCMTHDDMEAVQKGCAQELPPDSFGRTVVFFKRNCVPKELAESRPVILRALFYVLHRAALDESAQRHGFVFLYDAKTVQLTPMLRKRVKLCLHLVEKCAPIRLRACHTMYPPSRSLAQLVRPVVLGIMGTNFRQRTVLHLGTPHDHVAQLQPYGIHKDKIPVEIGGTLPFEASG